MKGVKPDLSSLSISLSLFSRLKNPSPQPLDRLPPPTQPEPPPISIKLLHHAIRHPCRFPPATRRTTGLIQCSNQDRLVKKPHTSRSNLSLVLEYEVDFYNRRKVFLAGQEKFHADADKNYWKTIADLIPNEVPAIKKRGKKEQEKQPSIVVVQGPKPGKPTDQARMRQILIKLKHNTPPHLKRTPPAAPTTEDAKTGDEGSFPATTLPKDVPIATPVEAVAVA